MSSDDLRRCRWVSSGLAFSPDGKRLAVGYQDSTVDFYDLKTKEVVRILEGHADRVTHLAFSPDGTRLASASASRREVFVWDAATGEKLSAKEGLRKQIEHLYWLADGKELLVAEEHCSGRLFSESTYFRETRPQDFA